MKKIILLPLLIAFININAQTTAIPDPNFEQALINLGLDVGAVDGFVPTANIDTVTFLIVGYSNISDLTGIEDFTALTEFYCYHNQLTSIDGSLMPTLTYLNCANNQLTSLDVAQNTALTELLCSSNLLTNLDVTQNTALTKLYCYSNLLTDLDVTQNTALIELRCANNQLNNLDVTQNIALTELGCFLNNLTSLDVSLNTALTFLGCFNNQLTCLNVKNGNNHNIVDTLFFAYNNPNLTCIEVDDVSYSTINWTWIDPQTSFSFNCPNSCFVGLEENTLSNLSIYPNPTDGCVVISLGEDFVNAVTIRNAIGQVVFSKKYKGNSKEINLFFDEPTGVYFVQIESNKETITKKIIKQ